MSRTHLTRLFLFMLVCICSWLLFDPVGVGALSVVLDGGLLLIDQFLLGRPCTPQIRTVLRRPTELTFAVGLTVLAIILPAPGS